MNHVESGQPGRNVHDGVNHVPRNFRERVVPGEIPGFEKIETITLAQEFYDFRVVNILRIIFQRPGQFLKQRFHVLVQRLKWLILKQPVFS